MRPPFFHLNCESGTRGSDEMNNLKWYPAKFRGSVKKKQNFNCGPTFTNENLTQNPKSFKTFKHKNLK